MTNVNDTRAPLDPDRCFTAEPNQRAVARELYREVQALPLICPHGHVAPQLLADEDATFGSPADLFVIPDHYVFRMLHSQGVALEELGIAPKEGGSSGRGSAGAPTSAADAAPARPVERDPRAIWQRFAEHFPLFRGTPTGLWIRDELASVFGVHEKLTAESAQRIYDQVEAKLATPAFRPRALFERFGIEVLATTDAATDTLEHHQHLRQADWRNVLPTFRPDAVTDVATENWRANVALLGERAGVEVQGYASFVAALERRRKAFRDLGATATDHGVFAPTTERLTDTVASAIFDRALLGQASEEDAARFTAHMLMEMARMSAEDGLVMQIHAGSFRNHDREAFTRFGRDMGADIPVRTEWTRALRPLLNAYGHASGFRLVVFTLDESAYGRELAPLAGYYPALRLGPPWWFYDSVKGIERYLDAVVETAGIRNLAGFNDDTRAFASIPARHDVWRRVTSNWLAGEVVKGLMDEEDAREAAIDLAYRQAKDTYRLGDAVA